MQDTPCVDTTNTLVWAAPANCSCTRVLEVPVWEGYRGLCLPACQGFCCRVSLEGAHEHLWPMPGKSLPFQTTQPAQPQLATSHAHAGSWWNPVPHWVHRDTQTAACAGSYRGPASMLWAPPSARLLSCAWTVNAANEPPSAEIKAWAGGATLPKAPLEFLVSPR